jgi:hypothetical protein
MSEPASASPTIRRLVAYLLDADAPADSPAPGDPYAHGEPDAPGEPDPAPDALGSELATWLAASPRFRAFAEANRDKIRKKLRGAALPEARLDVRAELRAAALLLGDRRIELVFEAYGAGRRGPDFTATFRAGRPFNIEVTRRHGAGAGAGVGAAGDRSLEAAVLGKLRQLPSSSANVLLVAVDDLDGAPDPGPVVRGLRARADRRDDAFFIERGLADAPAFHAGLLRLAAVVAWTERAGEGGRIMAWSNAGARITLPESTLRAALSALAR